MVSQFGEAGSADQSDITHTNDAKLQDSLLRMANIFLYIGKYCRSKILAGLGAGLKVAYPQK
jgi:hypothetical protein